MTLRHLRQLSSRVNARVAGPLLQTSLSQKRRRHHIAQAGSTSMFWDTAGADYYCLPACHTNGGYPKGSES
jgi:hypothetical protein